MDICSVEKCTGCGTCFEICPQKCISFDFDEFGFRVPNVDESLCLECGLCIHTCPEAAELSIKNNGEPKVYATWCKDANVVKRSTSGGAFYAIASNILSRNGVVYGCTVDESTKVLHIRVDNLCDLSKLHGSKYVQSNLYGIYKSIRSDLLQGCIVLFSGTPCQVAGIYSYLGSIDKSNLYTIDLVCHGSASPGFFQQYVEETSKEYHDKIVNIEFRNKEKSKKYFVSKIHFSQRPPVYISALDDDYMSCFLRCGIYRECCYECRYATINRVGDFTLGDFFGVNPSSVSNTDYRNGISLLLVNNSKSSAIFEAILDDINYLERPLSEAINTNLNLVHPSRKPSFRDELLKKDGRTIHEKKVMFCSNSWKTKLAAIISRTMPYRLLVLANVKRKSDKSSQ